MPYLYNRVLAIDATWLIRRQFHACDKGFVNSTRLAENGAFIRTQDPSVVVISFIQCVLKKIKELNYNYEVYLLFDRGSYHYRPKDKSPEYKADREYDATYECCWAATDIAIRLMRELGFNVIQVPGLEADDLGMYYSYNSEECILYTVDSDWRQSLTPRAVIHTPKKIISYDDVVNELPEVKTPLDLALSKAIDSGGHDNIQKVLIDNSELNHPAIPDSYDKHNKIMYAFKSNLLPEDKAEQIFRNLELTRLDQILRDTTMIKKIKYQETLTNRVVTGSEIESILSRQFRSYPAYFNGVIGKYAKVRLGTK